jgi:hypothetical protein
MHLLLRIPSAEQAPLQQLALVLAQAQAQAQEQMGRLKAALIV